MIFPTDWALCSKGHRQSPVDLQPKELLFDPNLRTIHIDKERVILLELYSKHFPTCGTTYTHISKHFHYIYNYNYIYKHLQFKKLVHYPVSPHFVRLVKLEKTM